MIPPLLDKNAIQLSPGEILSRLRSERKLKCVTKTPLNPHAPKMS